MTDLELLLNVDHILLLTHLIDGYSHAWNIVGNDHHHHQYYHHHHEYQQEMMEKKDENPAVCGGDRILFVNNSSADVFISQLFTDEAVLIPR